MERSDDDPIERVIQPHARVLDGAPVARVLPTMGCRAVGPIVFLDHFGPNLLPAGTGMDVRPHPHIGLSTVSYLFAGEIVHRDSLGSVATIVPGAIDVMTAGAGIVHSERSSDRARQEGGTMHGLQFWVAVPEANEDDAPSFAHHAPSEIPERAIEGGRVRVLLGAAFGLVSPASSPSSPVVVELWLDAGARLEIPREIEDAGAYVIEGALSRADVVADERFSSHTLVVRRPGASLTLRALAPSHVFLFGGPRLEGRLARDPRRIEWNFVATTKERIEAAKRRWRRREFPTIPGDDQERIPLPGETE
jgi:redox-sensitive bicupin YhaK (pirin superfamily)